MARPRLSAAEKARRAKLRQQQKRKLGAAATTQRQGMQFIRCPVIGGTLYVPSTFANIRGQ